MAPDLATTRYNCKDTRTKVIIVWETYHLLPQSKPYSSIGSHFSRSFIRSPSSPNSREVKITTELVVSPTHGFEIVKRALTTQEGANLRMMCKQVSS